MIRSSYQNLQVLSIGWQFHQYNNTQQWNHQRITVCRNAEIQCVQKKKRPKWIMSLHYLVKLEMLIGHVLPLGCYRKKLQNLFHLNSGPHICQIWIQLITACGTIAREDVQSTHHWSEWTETAIENGVSQAVSCHHCGSHLSV